MNLPVVDGHGLDGRQRLDRGCLMATEALETRYNGEKFRNRLAARWAVFFNTARIDYLYETDYFDLSDSLSFLPDFYLKRGIRFLGEKKPREDVWVAVAPTAELHEDDRLAVIGFVQENGKNVLLMAGDPDLEAEVLFIRRTEDLELDAAEVSFMELADGRVGLVEERQKARLERDEDRALIERSMRTPILREAYRAAGKTRFDRWMRRCRQCDHQFQPKNWYDTLCYPCQKKSGAKRANSVINSLDIQRFLRAVSPEQRRILMSVFAVAFFGLCAWTACQATAMPAAMLNLLNPASRPTATPPLPATYTPVPTTEVTMEGLVPGITGTRSVCSCSADLYECSDFASQEQAQTCFDFCRSFMGDVHNLDPDGDGLVCLFPAE